MIDRQTFMFAPEPVGRSQIVDPREVLEPINWSLGRWDSKLVF